MLIRFSFRICGLVVLSTLAIFFASLGVAPSQAEPNSFAALVGSWRGSGTLSPPGAEGGEPVRCRVNYQLNGNAMHQNLECAGTDYKIVVTSNLKISGANISGSWKEASFGLSGTASGLARGNEIYVRVASSNFQGRMSIKIAGGSHTVRITQFDPGKGKYLQMATINLRR